MSRRPALVASALLLAAACALLGRPSAPPGQATLIVTSQLQGTLAPCGCSASMRGGLSRVAGLVARARAEGHPVFVLDVGDGLFPAGALPEAAQPQAELRARAVASSLGALGLTARAPGPGDDARGAAFRQALQLPELPAGEVRLLEAEGHRLAVVRAGALAEARALGARARAEGAAFVAAVVDQPFQALLPAIAEAPELDLVLPARLASPVEGEEERALGGEATRVARPQSRGRSVLRVDLTLREPARGRWLVGGAERERELRRLDERIELVRTDVNGPRLEPELKALVKAKLEELLVRREALAAEPVPVPERGNAATLRFVPVEATLPPDPAVAEVEKAYDVQVGELNLAWAREHGQDCPVPSRELPGFVGSATCGACHPQAYQVWQASKHRLAYQALEQVGKQYHLDCVSCHVLGWQQPNGVCRIDRTEDRREVSCESCHGPGLPHLFNPVKGTIPRSTAPEVCTGCHDRENSPAFDYAVYSARIKGPGHGLDGGLPPDGGQALLGVSP